MNRVVIPILLLLAPLLVVGQRDTVAGLRKNQSENLAVKELRLTSAQKQWLDSNYKKLGQINKDSATALVKKNFGGISEASVEYMISHAGKMLAGDNKKQIAQMKKALDQLKSQKQDLAGKIQGKDTLRANTIDALQKVKLNNEILQLKMQLKRVEDQINAKETGIRKLED